MQSFRYTTAGVCVQHMQDVVVPSHQQNGIFDVLGALSSGTMHLLPDGPLSGLHQVEWLDSMRCVLLRPPECRGSGA